MLSVDNYQFSVFLIGGTIPVFQLELRFLSNPGHKGLDRICASSAAGCLLRVNHESPLSAAGLGSRFSVAELASSQKVLSFMGLDFFSSFVSATLA